ncbi:hypothetical protein [Pseudolactococcus paracarnosus]|uniref:Bacteriocin immunity protein n=1 Tax=Pseudolactococcus paracarnosus TaxID=2749962 RepID=A0A7L4WCD0_9LACT|nr:hypothetical protein [Lactococcus paracarnosus]SPC37667.1 hypothetical protein LPICM02_350016 [Lactococcus piscium]MCJ1977224.1 hypothetical protein [Lactococcus paracarnosus]MCJ1983280.1 hypothetical protein [Lactococcus paracarnosus]MCJ1993191.1 hypothetical protein [Lactococcus paracarnosus]MCJ1998090.1 hypothetical protein [Lactococcus paracarnosus]
MNKKEQRTQAITLITQLIGTMKSEESATLLTLLAESSDKLAENKEAVQYILPRVCNAIASEMLTDNTSVSDEAIQLYFKLKQLSSRSAYKVGNPGFL